MIEFAKVRQEEFQEICALYQDVIRDMNANGLRQWEWDIYPTREQLEKDVNAGKLYRINVDGELAGAFVLSGDLSEEYNNMEWQYGIRPSTLHRFAMMPEVFGTEVAGRVLAFAKEEEIENFIDFSYLSNAFIIDYLADVLTAEGLTDCYLVSADGYTRNLTSREKFRFNIFDRVGNLVYPAAVMEYQGPISLVYLKDYPNADSDMNYRGRPDYFIHLLVDPVDGMYRTSEENLVSYSYDMSCTDVLLQMLPCFVGGEFSVPEGVFSVWCEEDQICYNDEGISVKDLLAAEEISYRAVLKK